MTAYEVRVSSSTPWTSPKAYAVPAGLTATTSVRSLAVRPALGQTLCLRVRSSDRGGLWSAYTTRCVSRPLDDRSLRASTGWRRTTLSGGLQRTATMVARTSATLTTSASATVRRIGVQGVTCSTCGAVRVYVGRTYVGLVNLRGSAGTRLVYLPTLTRSLRGIVTLRTTSARTVKIDGLLLSQS